MGLQTREHGSRVTSHLIPGAQWLSTSPHTRPAPTPTSPSCRTGQSWPDEAPCYRLLDSMAYLRSGPYYPSRQPGRPRLLLSGASLSDISEPQDGPAQADRPDTGASLRHRIKVTTLSISVAPLPWQKPTNLRATFYDLAVPARAPGSARLSPT